MGVNINMEWIYTQTKVRSRGSVELTLKEERKKNGQTAIFMYSWFRRT
jgi:hypothetical protein